MCSCYKHIYSGKTPYFGSLDGYRTGKLHIDWLFERVELSLSCRPGIHLLLLNLPPKLKVRSYEGVLFKEPVVNSIHNSILALIMRWITIKSCSFNIRCRSLFLCLHLMHRIYSLLDTHDEIILFACCCFSIALVCIVNNTFDILHWKKIRKDNSQNYDSLFENMLINILVAAKGIIISENYWDYAMGAEDLTALLHNIINKDYDALFIEEVQGELNKNILILKVGNLLPNDKELCTTDRKIVNSIIYPCNLFIEDSIAYIENFWSKPNFDICEGIGVILCNKSVIKSICLTIALKICRLIYVSQYNVLFFNRICHFDWRNELSGMLSKGINPLSN